MEEFQRRLRAVADAMKPYGIVYSDAKLANVILVDDGIILVDLEYAREPDDDLARRINISITSFQSEYNLYLRILVPRPHSLGRCWPPFKHYHHVMNMAPTGPQRRARTTHPTPQRERGNNNATDA